MHRTQSRLHAAAAAEARAGNGFADIAEEIEPAVTDHGDDWNRQAMQQHLLMVVFESSDR